MFLLTEKYAKFSFDIFCKDTDDINVMFYKLLCIFNKLLLLKMCWICLLFLLFNWIIVDSVPDGGCSMNDAFIKYFNLMAPNMCKQQCQMLHDCTFFVSFNDSLDCFLYSMDCVTSNLQSDSGCRFGCVMKVILNSSRLISVRGKEMLMTMKTKEVIFPEKERFNTY